MRLLSLGYGSYDDYLRSSHWQAVKARYRASDQPQDCICGETDGLQLHHMTYERIGGESLADLTPLCASCHAMIHTLEARGEIGLDFTGFVSGQRAKRYEVQQRALTERRDADLHGKVAERRTAQGRSLAAMIRQFVSDANRTDTDISEYLDEIGDLIRSARKRLAQAA
jgi:hypothetical protein